MAADDPADPSKAPLIKALGDGAKQDGADTKDRSQALAPEVLSGGADAVDAARQTLDIDFGRLLEMAARGKAAEDGLVRAREALELREQFEAQRVKHFRDIMQTVIDAKKQDPDEIDRRESNSHRRSLTSLIALMAMGCAYAVFHLASKETTNIVALGIMSGITMVALAFTGVLASGGALSPKLVLNVIRAATGQPEQKSAKTSNRKSSGGRKK
ncbi:MAG TPA: hypothetical protein VEU33_22630 [Archangium sp.]|nr:hypothetical protein [Archangium sp.]